MGWRGFGFVHHSRTVFCRTVPNLSITIRNFFIAVRHARVAAKRRHVHGRGSFALAALLQTVGLGVGLLEYLTALKKVRIVILGFGTARQKTVLQ